MKSKLFCLFLLLCLPAWGEKIPVGLLRYMGDTPDGHSVFNVTLNPPAGVDLSKLTQTIYIGEPDPNTAGGITFVLPPPISPTQEPPSYEFLFLTGYGQFANCPGQSAAYVFYAPVKSTVTYKGNVLTIDRISASLLKPPKGTDSIAIQQAATVYLYVADD